MCVGIKLEDPLQKSQHHAKKQKQSNIEERKEKAKDAARTRRMLESDYFEELEKLLPITEPSPLSQQAGLDKTSIIRLNIAQLKAKDVLNNGIHPSNVREEILPGVDIFACLDGFSLVLGSAGDIVYISENVSRYQGLTQAELLGQQFSEYVHPCDQNQLKLLIPRRAGTADQHVEIFARVKCTVTERGRMINLKQADYKPLKISGIARLMPENKIGGITGTIFLGLATWIVEREIMLEKQIGVFTTKHSIDMKFTDTGLCMSSIAGYGPRTLSGLSFYDLVHVQDIGIVQKAFKKLVEHGQCETSQYRLLCHGGGFVWLQTKACLTLARLGASKEQNIFCTHQQISEIMNKEEILATIQMKNASHVIPSLTKAINSIIADDAQGTCATIYMNKNRKMEKKMDAAPTSVIVKRSHLQPQYVSVPVIPNSRATVEKDDVLCGKADSLEKNTGPIDLNTTTQSIFNICNIAEGSHSTSDILEELHPTINLNDGNDLVSKENNFLEDILDDIERRSPHSGDECVVLGYKSSEKEKCGEAISFDSIQMFNFDDNFDADAREFFKPSEKLTSDETQVLVDKNKTTIQHSYGQSFGPYDHLQYNRGIVGLAEDNEGTRKRCQSDVTAEEFPQHMQRNSKIIICEKHRIWQNSLENCPEPSREKIDIQTKDGKEFSEEQKSYLATLEEGSFKKRLKLNNKRPPSLNTNPVGENNLHIIRNPYFDAKFGNSLDEEKMCQMYEDFKKWCE